MMKRGKSPGDKETGMLVGMNSERCESGGLGVGAMSSVRSSHRAPICAFE